MLWKTTALGFSMILTFCLVNEPGLAANKVYVTDIQRITLRTGPTLENKIIALLTSGQLLEVIEEQEKWSRVRVMEDGNDEKEGWVLNQYLIDRMPYKLQVSSLMDENNMLKEKLEPTKQQLEKSVSREKMLSTKLQETEATLRNVQKEFEILKRNSSEYLKLKTDYDAAQAKLNQVTKKNEILNAENRELVSSERNKWFIAGALVLICGLVLGLLFGRQQKRRSSYY